jgi:hypothetical protein
MEGLKELKKSRDAIVKKWEESGVLDNIKGLCKNEKLWELFQGKKVSKIDKKD